MPRGGSPAERGVRRFGSWPITPVPFPWPKTTPPVTTLESRRAAARASKPSEVELYVPPNRPRPGVGSNGSQP